MNEVLNTSLLLTAWWDVISVHYDRISAAVLLLNDNVIARIKPPLTQIKMAAEILHCHDRLRPNSVLCVAPNKACHVTVIHIL